jgi:hypothetical protein
MSADREYHRRWRAAHREQVRASQRRYDESHREEVAARKRAARRTSPEQAKARSDVSNALKAGGLTRQSCEVCGAEPAQAHHDDYTKTLIVRWLCRQHHDEYHMAANA